MVKAIAATTFGDHPSKMAPWRVVLCGRRYLLTCVLLCACSVHEPTLLDSGSDSATQPGDSGPDTGLAGDGGGDTGFTSDAGADTGSDSRMPSGCIESSNEFCPLLCPESCNGMDDDCDGRIDEREIDQDTLCDLPSASATCVEGSCIVTDCLNGMRDCDGDADNGCETDPTSDANHCGLCNRGCSVPGGDAICVDSNCTLAACQVGFGDCDGSPDNGCELRLDSLDHCGGCGIVCDDIANGQVGCIAGSCGIVECVTGFGDCDDDPENGCETALDDIDRCGSCDTTCSFTHASALCAAQTCTLQACGSGYGDCDGNPDNGCEITLSNNPSHCGACATACANQSGGDTDYVCVNSQCVIDTCPDGFADCDGAVSNNCETPTTTLTDCGACNVACLIPNAEVSCSTGSCTFVACSPGYADCDSDPNNGCEQNLDSDTHCGACNTVCDANTGHTCVGGLCTTASCTTATADCDGDGVDCEQSLSALTHCGACGAGCGDNQGRLPNASASCASQTCAVGTCDSGFGDCDLTASNGCEASLRTTANCGVCGVTCDRANASVTCASGTCAVDTCNTGFASCDGNPANGCETRTNTATDCGACDTACAQPNAVTSCAAGTCARIACTAGYGDCDGNPDNGCEQPLNTLTHCGACNSACDLDNAAESCSSGTCSLNSCSVGFGNCDFIASNGCETSLSTLDNCGGCGAVCDYTNASESCESGTCALTQCDATFGDCDSNLANGCEASVTTLTDCGGCGVTCSLPNTTAAACENATCQVSACVAGFADCNLDGADGCEQPLNTTQHCGSCGVACSPANGTGSCASGQCAVTSCANGYGDCDGLASNGCERALNGGSCRPLIGRVEIDDAHGCAVKPDGRVACWGYNGDGRLGDGTTTERWAPGHTSPFPNVTLVGTGDAHSCAVLSNGQVMCWGNNGNGRLGDGTTAGRITPVPVSGLNDAVSVSLGRNYTCALRTGGQVMCWGDGSDGRLGNNSILDRETPDAVSGVSDALQVSVGEDHACALRNNGQIACWGNNDNGKLGDNTTSNRTTPVTVMGITDAIQVSAGEEHTCAVRANGSVMCWGDNGSGRLGDNTITERRTPVTVMGITDAAQVSTGYAHTCAVRATGQVMCWGNNGNGRLGDNTSFERRTPVPTPGLTDAVEVSTGDFHTCAMRTNGRVSCWGYGASGRLGNGTSTDRPVPTPVSGFNNGTAIGAGGGNGCALLSTGEVHCWGYGGRNGNGTTATHRGSVAATITNATQIAVGWEHACVVRESRQVWCWGTNDAGQLGDGSSFARSAPVRAGLIDDAVQVSTNGWTTCAVSETGRLYSWGYNAQGQLGIGNLLSSSTPLTVLALTDAVQVSVGHHHTCYLRQDGGVRCAGEGLYGALGNNATARQTSFVSVSNLSDATQIDVGYYHSCALRSGGAVSCWGRNDFGQLGDGTTTQRNTPVNVAGLSDAIQIVGGELFTCALRQSGQVMCWGQGANGRLGEGATANRSTPVNVTGVNDAVEVSAGWNHACALRQNGEVVCWGYNGLGQLGDGTLVDRTTRVPIVSLP